MLNGFELSIDFGFEETALVELPQESDADENATSYPAARSVTAVEEIYIAVEGWRFAHRLAEGAARVFDLVVAI